MTQDEITQLYSALREPPKNADKAWYQRRGYDFERLLFWILERDKLSPRTSYKKSGEQIDGSFLCDGRVFLLEAKWQAAEAPASTIYQFKGKVEGKLVGTLGVFISMTGYTSDCVDALVLGKSLDVILLDQSYIDLAVSSPGAFAALLRLRMREAAETGSIYRSASPDDLRATPYAVPPNKEEEQTAAQSSEAPMAGKIAILCEGRTDSFILHDLAFRILKENGLKAEIQIVQAGGKQNLPRVANLFSTASGSAVVIIVADSEGDMDGTRRFINESVRYDGFELVTPDPCIESWLLGGDKVGAATARARQLTELIRRRTQKIEELLDAVGLAELRSTDVEFAKFYELIRNAGVAPDEAAPHGPGKAGAELGQ